MGQDEYHKKAKFYWLSNHAIERLEERSSLCARDLAVLISNASIPIFRDGAVINAMIYSPLDEKHVIAAYDEGNLQVITILPPDYHFKSSSSDIGRERLYVEAKKLVESKPGLAECLTGRHNVGYLPYSLQRLAIPGISVYSKSQ